MEETPLVSIITPNYNYGKYLEETILSVKTQDYPRIEHIILDGGSTDNSLEIIRKYEGTYNMRWISEPDRGESDAINKGFRMAKGEIATWLDSDDVYFDKQVVSCVVEQFKKEPGVAVVYGDDVLIDKDSRIFRIRRMYDWDYGRLRRGFSISQPAAFITGEIIRQNLLDESLRCAFDLELWLRLGKDHSFKHVNRILAGGRIHRARISLASKGQAIQERGAVQRKYGQKFNLMYHLRRDLVDIPDLMIVKFALAIPRILRIEREVDTLAFNAGCRSKIVRLFSQMAPGYFLEKFKIVT